MQVAVAGVKDVGDAQPAGLAEPLDFAQHGRKRGARDDAVLHEIVRRDAADGGKGGLASLPDGHALGLGLGNANLPGAALGHQRREALHEQFDLARAAV